MDEFDIFDQEEEFEDSIYRDLAYLDRELSDEEKKFVENDRITNAPTLNGAAQGTGEERAATESKEQVEAQDREAPDSGSAEKTSGNDTKSSEPETTPTTAGAASGTGEERAATESKEQAVAQREAPDTGSVEKPSGNDTKSSEPETTPTPDGAVPIIGEQQPAAAFDLPEETPNGASSGAQQGSDEKAAQKDGKDSLLDSFLDLMRGDFGWDQELPSAEALDAMIKQGDILDKEGEKLVGDTPEERKKALEKRLKDGEILYVYKKGEKFPRQVTYDEKSKEFGVSEPVDKLELEKVAKPHWLVRFYFNLFSLMYRGKSMDAVRDWMHYEHQKEAIAKAKSKSRLERRKRRDPSLNEKEKDKEKAEEKTEEKVKEEVKENPEEVKEEPRKEESKEVKEEPKEVKKEKNEFRLLDDDDEEKVKEEKNEFKLLDDDDEEPVKEDSKKEIDGVTSEKELLDMDRQFEKLIEQFPECKEELKKYRDSIRKMREEHEERNKEQEKTGEREQPVEDAKGPVIDKKEPTEEKNKGLNDVYQDPVPQTQKETTQPTEEKEPEKKAELKAPKEGKSEEELKARKNENPKAEIQKQADEKTNGENRKEENVSEYEKLMQQLREQQKDKDTSLIEKNIRTLYENAENAKKQLSLNCEKGESFRGGDGIAQIVAYNNVKNQIEGNGLSYTVRQILSSADGPKMMCDGAMGAAEVKYAANEGHRPSFYQDNFLNQDQLDAITELADQKMEKTLSEENRSKQKSIQQQQHTRQLAEQNTRQQASFGTL